MRDQAAATIGYFLGHRGRSTFAIVAICASTLDGRQLVPSFANHPDAPEAIHKALTDGAYAKALQLSTEWVGALESIYGRESSEVAIASDLLIEALVKSGKAQEDRTISLAEHIVLLKERHFGPQHLETAGSLHNLGSAYSERGEFDKATAAQQQALTVRRRLLPATDPQIADSLDALALPLIYLERYAQAQRIIDESQRLREPSALSAPLALANTLYLSALLHRYDGDYSTATVALDQVFQIRDRLTPKHPDNLTSLRLKGDLLFLKGNVQAAQHTWEEALSLAEETLGPDHPIIPRLLRVLASAAQELGNLTQGRQLLERGVSTAERALTPCDRDMTILLNNLGILAEDDGRFDDARKYLGTALTKSERCLGPTHSMTATVINNQAELAFQMGEFERAETLYGRAVTIWSTSLGPNHPYVARGVDSLAEVAEARGQVIKAGALLDRALSLRSRSLGTEHPDVASTLVNMSRTSAAAGNVPRAVREVTQALAIYGHGGVPQDPDYFAKALNLKGQLQARQGNFIDARASFVQALDTRERVFGADHPLAAEARASLARADYALGANADALNEALDAEGIGRDHLRFTIRYLPERQALAYADKRPRGLDLALSILAAGPTTDPVKVLDSVAQSRGVVLDELAARAQSAGRSDPASASLNAAAASARERFANLMLRSIQGDDPVSRSLLDEARTQKEEAERALAEKSQAARAELAQAHLGLDEIRRAIPTNTALVSFVRYERTTFTVSAGTTLSRTSPAYIGFVTRPDVMTIDAIPLGSASAIDDLVRQWHNEIIRGAAAPVDGRTTTASYRTIGTTLRRRIWDPIASHLGGTDRVFIVPDGSINMVAFDALPTALGKYLVENGPVIHYLSAERDIVASSESAPIGNGLLAVGGAAFDSATTTRPVVAPTAPGTTRSGCGPLQVLHFDPLPGTRREVTEVAGLWKGNAVAVDNNEPAVLTGREASEGEFKRRAPGHRILHLATHGFFLGNGCGPAIAATRSVGGLTSAQPRRSGQDAEDNPLILSGLALAGANRRTATRAGEDDGILTAEEVTALNLEGVEWAVLSACDTGLGQVKAGEGVLGLRRAFQIAGARTVIMSLWSVEDQSTRNWMRALYEGRFERHLSTADAVHDASLRILQSRRAAGQSTHPFFWAAFVAAGDWK